MRWINLRNELQGLINGDVITVPQGQWVVLRVFRHGQYSQYWNTETREAVGGPKFLYDDVLVRVINIPGPSMGGVSGIRQGMGTVAGMMLEDINTRVFAIEHNTKLPRYPKANDIVYLIDKYASVGEPEPPFRVTDRYKILNPYLVQGDYGRAEIILVRAERIHGES